MNTSFVSYGNHEAALKALQLKFPTAIMNGTEFNGRQLLTVVGGGDRKAIRKALKGFSGHMFPSYS